MKRLISLILVTLPLCSPAQVVLDADGPGDTYALITSVLAPGYNPIETPDCSHTTFGNHIDEVFDNTLNSYVFRFHIHTNEDNDRCKNFDRQRNEIKTYGQSPDNLLGIEGETVIYKWKFKLDQGFQSSSSFTHIHQLKSVGGSLESMPMYTLTTRKGNPDQLELRYAETNSQTTLKKTDLSPLVGTWLEVTETIKYGTTGTYDIIIKKVSDNSTLFSYTNSNIVNWRPEATFVRPKWGIYRSLNNVADLRDEMLWYANFSIEEPSTLSTTNSASENGFIMYPNPVNDTLFLKQISPKAKLLQIFSMDGKKVLEEPLSPASELKLDVTALSSGNYILKIKGEQWHQSKHITISNK
ncbi:T9SS type A sorting domain-containing protein [Pseudotamlana carrageenivorans]|uniref:Fibronectin type III n=1 Tax=Pseudotamlana carrageenivorans TaxID=2069432 RepID=A0A2I7SJM3_9FLAO|nr:T9SS type A sorting domain-containing protein [Tamlana carrageenivorans]AUS06077.1 fibronectin type III [Tamlana carrageenivorans]